MYFAYGANMSHAVMRKHAPDARALGVAALVGYRFVIGADGYASVTTSRAHVAHGVLWRITPRDRTRLDAWENVAGGLYRAIVLPVRFGGRRVSALVYVGRSGEGRTRPGYMDLVLDAAREWELPPHYIRSLEPWRVALPNAVPDPKIREFRW